MIQSSSASSQHGIFVSFSSRNKEAANYDLGELDQALYLYINEQDQSSVQEEKLTLNIFPPRPTTSPGTKAATAAVTLSTPLKTSSSTEIGRRSEQLMALDNARSTSHVPNFSESKKDIIKMRKEPNRTGAASAAEHEGPKAPDTKTLRRLAQNREAARKSRLRKKAYIQQLESSKIRLAQLEQELNRTRAQGLFVGGVASLTDQGLPNGIGGLNSDAAMFDMEYARWVEEHYRLMCELRAAVQEHLPENQLRILVDHCVTHYEVMMNLKSILMRSDVFHLVSGMWKTPAERCFMWIGGFRPSDLIKVIVKQVEPLTEQQILGMCGLQQSAQETEQALSQGLEALQESLLATITSDMLSSNSQNMASYMTQMAVAINKLSGLEAFVRQADNLRLQTLHRLCQLLTIRQAGRCFLAMAEYFDRLRALSSLWLARPRQDQ